MSYIVIIALYCPDILIRVQAHYNYTKYHCYWLTQWFWSSQMQENQKGKTLLPIVCDVIDTRTRRVISRILVTRRVWVIFVKAHPSFLTKLWILAWFLSILSVIADFISDGYRWALPYFDFLIFILPEFRRVLSGISFRFWVLFLCFE